MTGAWTLTDDGEWILEEPYASMLLEAKHIAGLAWRETLFDYVAERTDYDSKFLDEEFARRAHKGNYDPKADILDCFLIEAMEGNL